MPEFSEEKDPFVRCLAAMQTHTAPSAVCKYLSLGIFMRETKMEACKSAKHVWIYMLINTRGDTAEHFKLL